MIPKLVGITPISLWFMILATIVFMGFINQQTSWLENQDLTMVNGRFDVDFTIKQRILISKQIPAEP